MAVVTFDNRAPAEAVAYLEQKSVGGRFSFAWQDVWQAEHLNAFVVAKAATADILTDLHGALLAAIKDGWTQDRFAQEVRPLLEAKGWWGKKRQVDPVTGREELVTLGTPRRLRTIYDTNMRMAHSAGRWERFSRSFATRPIIKYHHTPQEHPRPLHLAWDGIALPYDHPFWQTHWCPNGWFCKCFATSHRAGTEITTEDQLVAKGVYRTRAWRNRRTGQVEQVPEGIDPGFGYNVGQARMAGLTPPAMPEPQRDFVAGDRTPRALPPPPQPRPLPSDVDVRPDLEGVTDPQKVFEALADVLGVKEGEVYADRAQVPLVMGQRMFQAHDAAGQPIGPKAGLGSRGPLAEIFGAVIRDPDEIWHSLQTRADGSSVLVRNLVGVFDVPQAGRQWFVVTFHEGSSRGVWMGTTAYGPGKTNKVRTQLEQSAQGHRVGTLVYRRPVT
jgi:hypothetical protein